MYAIVEFGSLTRQEGDCYSDRDLLIICPKELKKSYVNRYVNEGYSVTFLTKQQLVFMKEKGSLFLQHLRFESKIILDSNLEFSLFINKCALIHPSQKEVAICQKSIEFLSKWPSTPLLSAWKADFLFCLSRDYLIKCLARKGRIAFGLKDIEAKSKDLFSLTSEDFKALSTLRKVKAAYRSDSQFPEKFDSSISSWLIALNRTFGFNNHDSNFEVFNLNGVTLNSFNTPYEQLRILEALYLITRNMGINHPKHQTLINLIQKPNLYGSTKKINEEKVEHFVCELASLIAYKGLPRSSQPQRCASLQR